MSDRLITLAIETSNPANGAGEVAIGARAAGESSILALERLAPKRRHDDALMPAIDAAVTRAGLIPRDINRIAVSVGPGGFTGLRVAVATAKLIAEATGAACVPVRSSLVAARAASANHDVDSFIVALASKRDTAWVEVVTREAHVQSTGGAIVDDAHFAALIEAHPGAILLADDHLPPPMRVQAQQRGLRIAPPTFTAAACFELSCEAASVDALELAPIYPREPEAITKWRELHP